MKKIILSILALLLIASSSLCQKKIDNEKEKEAIKAVIENEANSHYARDWDKQSKSFLQDEFLRKYICVRFLEKVDGEWKIAYVSYVNTSSWDESETQ